jgi:hypothetical protein
LFAHFAGNATKKRRFARGTSSDEAITFQASWSVSLKQHTASKSSSPGSLKKKALQLWDSLRVAFGRDSHRDCPLNGSLRQLARQE